MKRSRFTEEQIIAILREQEAGASARQRHVERHRFKKMVTPVARRIAAGHLRQTYAVSQRRACKVIGADRT
jgi:hypothetical protein